MLPSDAPFVVSNFGKQPPSLEEGLGFRVLGLGVEGLVLGFRVLEFRVLGFRVVGWLAGLGVFASLVVVFRVQGFRLQG